MAKLTFRLGLFMAGAAALLWAIDGFGHWTALLPTILGLPIALCGYLTMKKPEKAVIFMHIAVVLAVALLGGAGKRLSGADASDPADAFKFASLWMTVIVCVILIGAFVQSFLKARAAKKG